jgi:hypothetical protein
MMSLIGENKWGIDPDKIAPTCQTLLCSLVMIYAALARKSFGCLLAVLKPIFRETKQLLHRSGFSQPRRLLSNRLVQLRRSNHFTLTLPVEKR